jgi:hypothetical protein
MPQSSSVGHNNITLTWSILSKLSGILVSSSYPRVRSCRLAIKNPIKPLLNRICQVSWSHQSSIPEVFIEGILCWSLTQH